MDNDEEERYDQSRTKKTTCQITPSIKVTKYPHNGNYKRFHVRDVLFNNKGDYISGSFRNEIKKKNFPHRTLGLYYGIMSIPGVTEVEMLPYKINVQIAESYTWEEILPQVKVFLIRYTKIFE